MAKRAPGSSSSSKSKRPKVNKRIRPPEEVELGSFPFPLRDSTSEPAPLQWVRNHASYLTVGGLHDYFVPIAVLARGIAVNFLILVPWLIVVSIILSFAHHWILNQEFLLLQIAAGVAVCMCLAYLVGTPLLRIFRYRQSLERGAVDTAEQRIFREKLLGFSLILILIIAFIELSPWLIEEFRDRFGVKGLTWSQKLASVVGLSTILGSSNAILSKLGGYKKNVAIIVIGFAGLLVPWTIILYVTNYLVYDPPPHAWLLGIPFFVGVACAFLTLLALLVGGFQRSFSLKEGVEMSALILGVVVVSIGLWFTWTYAEKQRVITEMRLGELSRPIKRLVRSDVTIDGAAATVLKELSGKINTLNEKFDAQPVDGDPAFAAWQREYYQLAQEFVEEGEEIRNLSDIDQFKIEKAIAVRDRADILNIVDKKREKNREQPINGAFLLSEIAKERVYLHCKELLSEHLSNVSTDKSTGGDLTEATVEDSIEGWMDFVTLDVLLTELRNATIPAPMRSEFTSMSLRGFNKPKDPTPKPSNFPPPNHTPNRATRVPIQLLPSSDDKARPFVQSLRKCALQRIYLERQSFGRLRALESSTSKLEVASEGGDPSEKKAAGFDVRKETEIDDAGKSIVHEMTPSAFEAPTLAKQIQAALTGKALSYFTTKQLLSLADIDHLVLVEVPENVTPILEINGSEGSDDITTIWHARQAFEGAMDDELGGQRKEKARNLLAKFYTKSDPLQFAALARSELIQRALSSEEEEASWARVSVGELFKPAIPSDVDEELRKKLYSIGHGQQFGDDELLRVVTAHFVHPNSNAPDQLVARMATGEFGSLDGLEHLDERLFLYAMPSKFALVCSWAIVICMICWLAADININSLHGYYRDRLARAFIIRTNFKTNVCEVDDEITLASLANRQARSTAPYHLINVALNLQGSADVQLRDRKSDFFIFSKRFVGGRRTGYCRTSTLGQIFPQASLSTAMAISAAAASPNMGRITNPFLVLLMTLLNIRLGYWIPHPGLVEETQHQKTWQRKIAKPEDSQKLGFQFDDVFQHELLDIEERWQQAYEKNDRSIQADNYGTTVQHGLIGLSFSGGGIRSATVNLGILQVLDQCGIFLHVDFMSTVSGGGYLGSSVSALMRNRTMVYSQNDGAVKVRKQADETVVEICGDEKREYRFSGDAELEVRDGENICTNRRLIRRLDAGVHAEFDGTVLVDDDEVTGQQVVEVSETTDISEPRTFKYSFTKFDPLVVKTGSVVKAGEPLVARRSSLAQRFAWAVAPRCLYREMFGLLNEEGPWVNLSDGGHIENLAIIELLRRRCKVIFAGDGEADPNHTFNGVATLLRFARIDLGIEIELNLDPLRKDPETNECEAHWAIGRITYPRRDGETENEIGYLVYMKSSVTGDEGELINEYRNANPDFPHQSTADQFFNEGQFEAYRALGQHIGESLLVDLNMEDQAIGYGDIESFCNKAWKQCRRKSDSEES